MNRLRNKRATYLLVLTSTLLFLKRCNAFQLPISVHGRTRTLTSNRCAMNKDASSELQPRDFLPRRELVSSEKNNATLRKNKAFAMLKTQPSFAVPMLLPWSLWMHARSEMRGDVNGKSIHKTNIKTNRKNKRRWEIPLTSKPFEGFEFLRSTVTYCLVAIAIYFTMGTFIFPLWLEPSWTFIDSLYFSMTTLTTCGYGDLVPGHCGGIFGKIFLLFFNVYAVCISVSALGVIAKLALTQQKKLITKAKERARSQLIKIFDSEDEDDEDETEEDYGDEDEECRWIDNILNDRCSSDERLSIPRVLISAIRNHSFNFVALLVIAAVLQRVEKWHLVDLLYYWNSTATTIGFGDVAPKTQLGRLIAVLFVPLSVVTMGEVIANCFAFVTSRASAKAEKDFLRREITLSDLEYLDIDDDGMVNEMDFVTFMLVAMQKVSSSSSTTFDITFGLNSQGILSLGGQEDNDRY